MDNVMERERDGEIIAKYIKIDGLNIENPLPRFEYGVRIGTWAIIDEADKHADFYVARQDQAVEIEIGMHFGTVRGVGTVKIWQSPLPNIPAFVAKVTGGSPLSFVEHP
jgi:hypothetical protein